MVEDTTCTTCRDVTAMADLSILNIKWEIIYKIYSTKTKGIISNNTILINYRCRKCNT